MKPTIYIHAESHHDRSKELNPVDLALRQVVKVFGGEPVDELVTGDVEAAIALTDSVSDALRFVKETENTAIILVHLRKEERVAADGFAARYPGRVFSVPFVSDDDEASIVPFMIKFIAEKIKEVQS